MSDDPTKRTMAVVVVAVVMVASVNSQEDRNNPQDKSESGSWVFSLLPTALQKEPLVRFNVITEMTDAGRQRPQPSAEKPAYYLLRPGGYFKLGEGAPARQDPPPREVLLDSARHALAANGYVAADDASDPISLIVMLDWGSFSWGMAITQDGPKEVTMERVLRDPILWQELVERASLVGGVQWAERVQKAMEVDASGSLISHLDRFQRNTRDYYLLVQTFQDFYFVVATAWDQAAAAEGERVLLWRTKMTVASGGVSMSETLNPLIASAAPYFGVEMDGLTRITKRIDRDGQVEMAPIEVIELVEPGDTSDSPSEESEALSPTEDE